MARKFEFIVCIFMVGLVAYNNASMIQFQDILNEALYSDPANDDGDVTGIVNATLRYVTRNWDDPATITPLYTIPIDAGSVVRLNITFIDLMAEHLKDIYASNCFIHSEEKVPESIDFTFVLDSLLLNSDEYAMDGFLADTIPLVGTGPMSILAEDLTLNLVGSLDTPSRGEPLHFNSLNLDIEIKRWTVDFEGVMPGTDLGVLFNEFFSMVGPELLDLVEIQINNGTGLIDLVNDFLSPFILPTLKPTEEPTTTTPAGF